MYSVLCRPSCNPFMKDPLKDSEIVHSAEGGDVERGSNIGTNSFVFVIACILLSIVFHFSYMCNCSSCIL